MNQPMKEQQFTLGQVLVTPSVSEALDHDLPLLFSLLDRHARKDWGNVCSEDSEANEQALIFGDRLFSAYDLPACTVWVLTEADRSATTVMLPCDY